jgi:DNA-binding transcriptional LysR family regulator
MASNSLADLDAFVAVARSRSFRGAAYVRNVSASTLSEAVRRLETRLGLRLLNRTTRSVTPTEAGQRLLDALAPALEDVAEAIDAIHSEIDLPAGTLRLNVPSIAARAFLPGLLSRFLLRHPRIRVEVVVEDRFIDVLAAGFDAGIRYDERLEGDMIAIPIGPRRQRFITAASPSWLGKSGVPTHPEALDPVQCIRARPQDSSPCTCRARCRHQFRYRSRRSHRRSWPDPYLRGDPPAGARRRSSDAHPRRLECQLPWPVPVLSKSSTDAAEVEGICRFHPRGSEFVRLIRSDEKGEPHHVCPRSVILPS